MTSQNEGITWNTVTGSGRRNPDYVRDIEFMNGLKLRIIEDPDAPEDVIYIGWPTKDYYAKIINLAMGLEKE